MPNASLLTTPDETTETHQTETPAGTRRLVDQRLATLVHELAQRDHRHLADAVRLRPVSWLVAMTGAAVVLAFVAVAVAVAPA
ncbi:hypothetical protein ELQ90_10085 [Labedella phragmitis]|uniref:Uncharacterized protein n=1 Tax=Labedella phragmitis TaxID=2498849 RepID=A0A444PTE1_9MICO|nr:hypothetical protein [Labedella phragmitis]RWZ51127.1 hypothetical protein ELQ90_10085 [Labedella phragmitis]